MFAASKLHDLENSEFQMTYKFCLILFSFDVFFKLTTRLLFFPRCSFSWNLYISVSPLINFGNIP